MTTDSEQTHWSVAGLLDLFDARPVEDGRFIADTGIAAEDERQVVEGTQVLAQVIVAVAKRFPEKSVRSVHAVFARAVLDRLTRDSPLFHACQGAELAGG